MRQLIECVPNFSEGRDMVIIEAIAEAISSTEAPEPDGSRGRILHIDRGHAANRTVITFAGEPQWVVRAAFEGVRCASRLIDMRKHQGTHPRSGAVDVLPLVPIKGITLEECATLARGLAERIFNELGIPCYCYEAAALKPSRKNLAVCRSGEYEALKDKIGDPVRRPDFCDNTWTVQAAMSGAVNVGARNILTAVNFNLNTKSASDAHEIAVRVREKAREITGPDGNRVMINGPLKGCKAIGWYIEEYGCAQVSMNITDISATPLHKAYLQVCATAEELGMKVTGTEIIGLVSEDSLVSAGRHFLACNDISTEKAIETAVKVMRLDSVSPFDAEKKIIERLI